MENYIKYNPQDRQKEILQKILKRQNKPPKERPVTVTNNLLLEIQKIKKDKIPTEIKEVGKILIDWKDANELLKSRIQELKVIIDKHFTNYDLYLFGSQMKGRSRSGSPDIDLWIKLSNDKELGVLEKILLIKKEYPYKLDLTQIKKDFDPKLRGGVKVDYTF